VAKSPLHRRHQRLIYVPVSTTPVVKPFIPEIYTEHGDAADVNNIGSKFATGVINPAGNLLPVYYKLSMMSTATNSA
jgi:hypothetical protein